MCDLDKRSWITPVLNLHFKGWNRVENSEAMENKNIEYLIKSRTEKLNALQGLIKHTLARKNYRC